MEDVFERVSGAETVTVLLPHGPGSSFHNKVPERCVSVCMPHPALKSLSLSRVLASCFASVLANHTGH